MKPLHRLAVSLPLLAGLGWFLFPRPATPGPPAPATAMEAKALPPGGPLPPLLVTAEPTSAEPPAASLPPLQRPDPASWRDPGMDSAFARFADWVDRYASSTDPVLRGDLETEGLTLVRQRRNALASMIQARPQRALELALPHPIRQALPASLQALLEQPINGIGELAVLCQLPLPGQAAETRPLVRTATLDGREYQAFVFGRRLHQPTRARIPLHGIAIDDLLAVDEHAVRVLVPEEAAARSAELAADPVCNIAAVPLYTAGDPMIVELAGRLVPFCSPQHADEFNRRQIASEEAAGPVTLGSVTAESNYTEGRKRFLLYRIDFPDSPGEKISVGEGTTLIANLNTYYTRSSYGRMTVALVGQGSTVTPLMRLPLASSNYTSMGTFLTACRDAARAIGIDPAAHDFDFVCTRSVPSASFAGLGYVGGVGFWLANGYFGVGTAAHEAGHNLGLNHASFWDTGGASVIGAGSSEEYGDPYDTMGGGGGLPDQYNSRYKNDLDWIAPGDAPTVTSNGVYRLFAHDLPDATGVRGLRVVKSSSRNYWLEFRQSDTANRWLMNGAGLRWTRNDSGNSLLLDTTPGSRFGKDDSAIVIGRTFSDWESHLHFTPLGKARTFPESLDIAVFRGPFPSNHPPRLLVTASSLQAPAGSRLAFSAAATDADGDPLAYFWDFGTSNGDFGTNSPSVDFTFSATDEYVVRCTVSDLKGGTASDSVVVRIGAPTTLRISGRVLRPDGAPVEGALVAASSTRYAYTDSDGSYVISRLAAGSYTLTATLAPYPVLQPWFSNPIPAGTSQADFIALDAPPTTVSLVAANASWRYRDDGSNLGTTWTAPAFADSGWASGPAELGYGEDDEATAVGFGPDANNKYITTYFRHSFVVSNPSLYTNLTVGLVRDDGAAVYLNGTEVFRDNLPAGALSHLTPASTTTEGSTRIEHEAPASLLTVGTNVIAVEVHQSDPASSDLSFALDLNAVTSNSLPAITFAYLASPADGAALTAPVDVPLSAVARANFGAFSQVDFYADGNLVGSDTTDPYSLVWSNAPPGTHTITVTARHSSGAAPSSSPVTVAIAEPLPSTLTIALTQPAPGSTVTLPAGFALNALPVAAPGQSIARVGFFANGLPIGEVSTPPFTLPWTPAQPGAYSLTAVGIQGNGSSATSAPVAVTALTPPTRSALLSRGSLWRYRDDGTNPEPAWNQPGFNDASWPAGPAKLGYGGDGEITTVSYGTNASRKPITTYFRRTFHVDDPAAFTSLEAQLVRDDAAVVYLNGVEVFRDNLVPGLVSPNSLAVSTLNPPGQSQPLRFTLSADGLRPGTNTIAVEVHQDSPSSPDLGFDLALAVEFATNLTDGIYLTRPASGSTFPVGSPIPLEAFALSPLPIAQVSFFDGSTPLGTVNQPPYQITWSNAPLGARSLRAQATLEGGATLASAPVPVTITPPPAPILPVQSRLVASGSTWKYLDDGTPLPAGWTEPLFDDSTWSNGVARLGFGSDGERTPLRPGAITYYFRGAFQVDRPEWLETLVLRLLRDDGAIVHLNGREIHRSNMPTGPITAGTPAASTVDSLDEQSYFERQIPAAGSGLLAGLNILAVEIHQSSATSTDASFDLELLALGTTAARVFLATPANNEAIALPAAVRLEAFATAGANLGISRVEFLADDAILGSATTPPYRYTWNNPAPGTHRLVARAFDTLGLAWDSDLVQVSVGYPAFVTQLVPAGALWAYLDNGSNQGTNWAQPTYNDSAWKTGFARLGYGGDGEETTVGFGPNSASKYITTYFRRAFTLPDDATVTNLSFGLLRDDGAAVWLNGREVFRSNLPATGLLSPTTLALANVSNADEQTYFPYSATSGLLVPGTNILAVEVHQIAGNSSDLGFDLQLTAAGYRTDIRPPALSLEPTAQGPLLRWPSAASGWRLEVSTDPGAATSWQDAALPFRLVDEWREVQASWSNEPTFYRLVKP